MFVSAGVDVTRTRRSLGATQPTARHLPSRPRLTGRRSASLLRRRAPPPRRRRTRTAPGDTATTRLYLDGCLTEVTGIAIPARSVLTALARVASRPDITTSVAAWARVAGAVADDKFDDLDKLANELPPEGHAAPHSEDHVWTRAAAVASFVESYTELQRSDSGLNLRLVTAQHADPGDVRVNADLRRYQAHGIAWLEAAAEGGAGVILADDMGLGKTLQSIGLLVRRAGGAPTSWSARPHWSATGSGRSPASPRN
ncbi:hypothetical protein GCM10029992_46090 [Glycomyces albus]